MKSVSSIWAVSLLALATSTDSRAQPVPDDSIEEVLVTGRAQEFYLQTKSSLGNKFPDDLRDIPQSIQILPQQLIRDQAALDITDLYRNISSVSVFSYSGVTFRGFRQDEIRYDGLLGDPFSGFSVPLLYDIEQVEVIKGPSGALFGGGEPGGLINYVTKAPTEDRAASAALALGNFGLYGLRGDVSGPVSNDSDLFFRFAGAYEDTDTFRFNTNKRDIVLAADVEWKPNEITSVIVKYDYVDQDFQGARLRGVPVDDGGDFLTTRRFNTNEPSDFQRLEAHMLTGAFNRRLSESLLLTLSARHIASEENQNYHENRGLFEDEAGETFARREFRDQTRDIDQSTALAELVWNASIGGMEHTVLAGGEYYRRSNSDIFLTSSDSRRAGLLPPNFIVPDLNFFTPVYGLSDPSQFDPLVQTGQDIDFDQWGLYIQDQVRISDRLLVSLGGRFEGFSEDIDSTQTVLVTGAANRTVADQDDDAFTVRLGAVFDVTERIAAYANYSTGFNPQGAGSQAETNGGPFDPEEGELFEVGAKVDLFDGGLYLQTAIYQITKTNVLVADPTPGAPTGALATIGEARSRGFELDIVGDISDNWTFTFNYAFNDTKILEGSDEISNAVGDEFANTPDHQFGFWTRYDINSINSSVAFGGSYVSEQLSLSGQEVQSYAVFDATWITTWDNIQLQLNARNLFDESYAESGFLSRTGHFPGDPRVLRAELILNF